MATNSRTQIVSARREHIPFIAWAQLAAHRSHLPKGMWDFMLNYEDEAQTLRYMVAMVGSQQVHDGHWAGFLVAEVDGVPAAALTGYSNDEYPMEVVLAAANEANEAMGRSRQEVLAGWKRARSIMNVQTVGTPGAWTSGHVATHPDYRRRGLLNLLIAKILARGLERGATVASVGLFIGNDPAQRAYEKAGFKVVLERRDAEFERVYGCPGTRLMELTFNREWRTA